MVYKLSDLYAYFAILISNSKKQFIIAHAEKYIKNYIPTSDKNDTLSLTDSNGIKISSTDYSELSSLLIGQFISES